MSTAERAAGLDVGGPGEGVDPELLDGMRGGVAAAEEDAADGRAGKDFAEEAAEGDPEESSVGWGGWMACEEVSPPQRRTRRHQIGRAHV